jgi:GTPase
MALLPLRQLEPARDAVDLYAAWLGELEAAEVPRILALNKIDLIEPDARAGLLERFPGSVAISASTGQGTDDLLEMIGQVVEGRTSEVEAVLPYTAGKLLARLHDDGRVMTSEHEEDGVRVTVRARDVDLSELEPYLVTSGATDMGPK